MAKPNKPLWHPTLWPTWLVMGLWYLVSQLPQVVLVGIASLLAKITLLLNNRRCHIARRNLELCFPELNLAERETLLRKNLLHTFLGGLEIGTSMFCSVARLQRRSRVIGAEHLTQLDCGALLLSLHNTTVDTAGSAFNPRYDRVDMMYRAHKNPVFELLQRRGRQRFNSQTKLIDRKDVRGAIRAMRKGRWLWYAPDQDYGIKQGIFSQFFGVQAASVTATSRFARSANVPVVPFVHYRDDNYHCVVEVFSPLENFPSGDEAADVQRVNDWIESTVRQRPEQYLWVHRRFKTRPAGEPSVYKR